VLSQGEPVCITIKAVLMATPHAQVYMAAAAQRSVVRNIATLMCSIAHAYM